MRSVAEFFIEGLPAPSGSKNAFVVTPKSGKPRAVLAPASKGQKAWQKEVREQSEAAYKGEPIEGPVVVELEFVFTRPKSHYGTGKNSCKLKPSAPDFHIIKPDLDKLVRSTLDGMTGVLFADDKQVVESTACKYYGGLNGCRVTIKDGESSWAI